MCISRSAGVHSFRNAVFILHKDSSLWCLLFNMQQVGRISLFLLIEAEIIVIVCCLLYNQIVLSVASHQ